VEFPDRDPRWHGLRGDRHGNAVIMKPAEQSAVCGALLMEIFEEAGVPAGVLNLLSGDGAVIGKHLVDHKDIDMVAFTGSREVGLKIWESAGKTRPGQRELKRVVVRDGRQERRHRRLRRRPRRGDDRHRLFCVWLPRPKMLGLLALNRAGRELRSRGRASHFRHREPARRQSGDAGHQRRSGDRRRSYERIKKTVAEGRSHATLAFQQTNVPPTGYFIGPTIFTDVKAEDTLSQCEIFGPVLSVIKVRDLDEAIRVANSTEYALTAGFFSRSPANIERVKAELVAGNVYINRSCTGAVVGRHPFRRLQDVRRGNQSRRLRLPPELHCAARRDGEHHAARLRSRNDTDASRRVHGPMDDAARQSRCERHQLITTMKHSLLLLAMAATFCLGACADGIEPDPPARGPAAYSADPSGHIPRRTVTPEDRMGGNY
jgi:hypothetical protein